MKVLVDSGELFDGEEAPAKEKVGEFQEIGKQADKPAQPRYPGEGVAGLEEEVNQEDGSR